MSNENEVPDDVVEDFIKSMIWHPDTPSAVRETAICNVRGFWAFLHSDKMEGCQKALDEAYKAKFHTQAIVRGIPVWVCADEFTSDRSVGMGWGPEQIWATRRDDGTMFELTAEETDHWAGVAAESTDEWYDDEDNFSTDGECIDGEVQ